MAHDPWVPPYFGSWADLIQYSLQNPLGPRPGHFPTVQAARAMEINALPQDPVPSHHRPWAFVVSALVTAVNAKVLAATLPDGASRKRAEASASSAIDQILDDYCGTPPKKAPWPYPGPPPWLIPIATELSGLANIVEAGPLREGLNHVAGQVMQGAVQQDV
jgi:hypothetical protein